MDKGQCKIVGALLLGACAISLFVAYDRYRTNADNARAILSSPLAKALGTDNMEPATPTVSKYAALIAVLLGVGGVLFLAQSRTREPAKHAADERRRPVE